ncbi:MAG: hypothetical protein GY778_31440 [bacterium]|nr:hypothetical protein [bacterium]
MTQTAQQKIQWRTFCSAALAALALGTPAARAQTSDAPGVAAPPAGQAVQPQAEVDYDTEPPYTHYERRWNRFFPAPYRRSFRREYYPYGRPYYPRREWSPGGYGAYGVAPQGYFDDGYSEGFHDGRRFQKWQARAEKGLNSYVKAMRQGAEAFRSGDYGLAARQFILAARLNQGDAASRLHAVHAMTALGQYTAAVPALRRALQLQPRLVYLPLDIRSEYGAQADFQAHLDALADAARTAEDDPSLWLLLGYCQFFGGQPGAAVNSLTRAGELAPDDDAVERLLEVAKLSAPAERPPNPPPPEPAAGSRT